MSKNKLTPPHLTEAAYADIVKQAISQIRTARILIARQVNSGTQSVYWNLGKLLFEKQLEEGYGSGVINQLSIDLKNEFPHMGLSPRNLWNMKRFYERYYQADTKLLQAVAVLPWGHNLLLLDKIQSLDAVGFYANETLTKGWSRDLLLNAIKMDSFGQAQWSHITELARTQNSELLVTLEAGFRYIENESFERAFQGLFSEINLNSENSAKRQPNGIRNSVPSFRKLPRASPISRLIQIHLVTRMNT